MRKSLTFTILAVVCAIAICGCRKDNSAYEAMSRRMMALYGVNQQLPDTIGLGHRAVVCHNGVFVGRDSLSVRSFKGIPFAKPPVGELRWKPPVAADSSSVIREAYYFGLAPIQTRVLSQPGAFYKQGEDCLTLNVWTAADSTSRNRPVMVFIHGGSYGWGATSDPMFEGHNFVAAHQSVVLVTVEYRLGIMGFVDLSSVPGGDAYRYSGNLGLLDQACALQWVHDNISGFGGDPDNVTIFGESAGAGSVTLQPLIKQSQGLFKRFIAESGSVALTFSREECANFTNKLLEASGAKDMAQLVALTEDQIMAINDKIANYNNFPERDGIVLPEDLYAAYRDGAGKDIGMLTGTNAQEVRYWIHDMGIWGYRLGSHVLFENNVKRISKEDMKYVDNFMSLCNKGFVWDATDFYTELLFRVPAVQTAALHADNGGESYVYYWTYPSARKYLEACHTVELPYVFNNLTDTTVTGDNIDPALARRVQDMWVSYATDGDPSIPGYEWPRYDSRSRISMVLGEDTYVKGEILAQERRDIEPLLKYGFNGNYAVMSLNVPYIYRLCGVAVGIIAIIVGLIVAIVKGSRRHRRAKEV